MDVTLLHAKWPNLQNLQQNSTKFSAMLGEGETINFHVTEQYHVVCKVSDEALPSK